MGCPPFFRNRGAPLTFAETGFLTVCGRPGANVFLLKMCLCPYLKFLDLPLGVWEATVLL